MITVEVYRRIISGEGGWWAAPIRGLLRGVEPLYAAVVGMRNRHHDKKGPSYVAPVPVISVGNITAGGTGKTPLVIEIVRLLEQRGRTPVVVSRGYGQANGEPNDEERVIRRNCPNVVCLADPDRAAGCERACREFGADVIVLDDAFQHRRVARTCDIVVVDATCPFGYDHVLPRGLLREPVPSLRRADMIVLTRCDQVSKTELDCVERRISRVAGDVPCLKSVHRVTGVERLNGESIEPAGTRAFAFAAVGQPSAFLTTVRSLGVEVVGTRWWPDHHEYTKGEIVALATDRQPDHDWLITTEKDAVKLADLSGLGNLPIAVVRIAIDFLGDGDTMLESVLDRISEQSSTL